MYRRFAAPALAAALVSCGQTPQTPAATTAAQHLAVATPVTSTWFICDGVDVPTLFVASEPDVGAAFTLSEYSKGSGAKIRDLALTRGDPNPGAGNVTTPLLNNGAPAGALRALDAGMLPDPASAYTPAIVSLDLGGRTVSCRWIARTRLEGFTARRSLVVFEDENGDLTLQTFDFTDAGHARSVAIDGAQRSSTPTLNLRGGAEETGPDGAVFRFTEGDRRYVVTIPENGAPIFQIDRGADGSTREPVIAAQIPATTE